MAHALLNFKCCRCAYTASARHARPFKSIMKHYDLVHATEPDFSFCCGVENCSRIYRNVRSYEFHLKIKHREFYEHHVRRVQNVAVVNGPRPNIDVGYIGIEDPFENPDERNDNADLDIEQEGEAILHAPGAGRYDIYRHLTIVMLSLREKYNVSETACSFVAQQIQSLVNLTSDQIVSKIEREQLDPAIGIDLQEILHQQMQPINDACQDLSSAKLLHKYVKQHMGYVEPVELIVGEVNGVSHSMQYVPILHTLKALLQHEDILAQVLQGHASQYGVLRDFCDGDVFQHNPLFQQHRWALQIELYYDDFTVTNPLGTRCRDYKLSAVYFILNNLHPKFRSQLDNIHLVALAQYSKVVAQHGLNALLRPVVDDIKILENEGIIIECHGQQHHFFGTVSFVASDNLGAHALGRFPENFSTAHKICRFCQARRAEFQAVHTDMNFPQRTKQAHNAQVRAVEHDETLVPVYSIKGNSVLNELQYYHIIDGLPSDIAHDCFEGLVPDITMKVLSRCVDENLFTFQELNYALESFQFAAADKGNKPGPIILLARGTARLKCTQSQMWCFVRIMPFLLGHLIPIGNPHWDLFLSLLDMIEWICAPAITTGGIGYMRGVIEDCLDLFRELYPEQNTKPKTHYITHYPTQTHKFGPLTRCWTIRLEGKHVFFKGIFQRTKNRIFFPKRLLSDTNANKPCCIHQTAS